MATRDPSTEVTADTTDQEDASAVLSRGIAVYDTYRNRPGTVMAVEPGRIWLRPVGGGLEWYAKPADLRPATASERLSPAVAVANQRSRNGGL